MSFKLTEQINTDGTDEARGMSDYDPLQISYFREVVRTLSTPLQSDHLAPLRRGCSAMDVYSCPGRRNHHLVPGQFYRFQPSAQPRRQLERPHLQIRRRKPAEIVRRTRLAGLVGEARAVFVDATDGGGAGRMVAGRVWGLHARVREMQKDGLVGE